MSTMIYQIGDCNLCTEKIILDLQQENNVNISKMKRLSKIIDNQVDQIDILKSELSNCKPFVEKYEKVLEENVLLKKKLDECDGEFKRLDECSQSESKQIKELQKLVHECKAERHDLIISNQKEALNELRQQIKQLTSKSKNAEHTQQYEQTKILAEIKAKSALADLEPYMTKFQQNKHPNEMNNIKLREVEERYSEYLESICVLLGINDAVNSGKKSAINFDKHKNNKITEDTIEKIHYIIQKMQDDLKRKDEMLRSCELDLSRLEQTEFLLKKKSEQLNEIQMSLRNKEDEIAYLKESMNKNGNSPFNQDLRSTNTKNFNLNQSQTKLNHQSKKNQELKNKK